MIYCNVSCLNVASIFNHYTVKLSGSLVQFLTVYVVIYSFFTTKTYSHVLPKSSHTFQYIAMRHWPASVNARQVFY